MNFKTHLLTLLIVCASSLIYSQEKIKGNKTTSIKDINVDGFNTLIINNNFNVTLANSQTPLVTVETDENIHDFIDIIVKDSVLSIDTTKKLRPSKKLNITVKSNENLKVIELNEDARLKSSNTIQSDDLVLKINDYAIADLMINSSTFKLEDYNRSKMQLKSKSQLTVNAKVADLDLAESCKIELTLKSDSLVTNLTQNAKLKLEGQSAYADIKTSETSNLSAKAFVLNTVNVSATGKSELYINVIDSIAIKNSGRSELELYGNPKITINEFSGTTKLLKKDSN